MSFTFIKCYSGIFGGACILAAPFTGGASLALGGVMCATSAVCSIAFSLIEAFGSNAQINKANNTFLEDKNATDALEEGIRQFAAKYEHFLKSLLTLRLLGDLNGLTINFALAGGVMATLPVLRLLGRKAIEESLEQGGKLAMKQGEKVISKKMLEKIASRLTRTVTKSVLKGVSNVVLGSTFVIIDLWELIRNVKDASGVGQIAKALLDQAQELENGLKCLEDYELRFQVQLAGLKKHMRMMHQLAEASKEVLTAREHIMTFNLLLCAMQKLDSLTEDTSDESDSDSDEEEEKRYKVATLNVRSLGARSIDKPSFIKKTILAYNTDILLLTETWFKPDNHAAQKLLQACCPVGYSYINHPFLSERPKCGVAIVYNAQKLNIYPDDDCLHRYDYGNVKDGGITGIGATFFCNEGSLDLSFKATSLYCPPEHGSMQMKCKRLMYIFLMYCELGICDLFNSIVDVLLKCKQPRRECIIGGDFNIHVNKNTDILAVAFKAMNKAAGFNYIPHTHQAPGGTHKGGNILDLIVSREYMKQVFVDDDPQRSSITDHSWVQGTIKVKGKSRPGKWFPVGVEDWLYTDDDGTAAWMKIYMYTALVYIHHHNVSCWDMRDLNQLLPQNDKVLKGHMEHFVFLLVH